MEVKIPFPLPFIPATHPDWDVAAFPMGSPFRGEIRNVYIAKLVGLQPDVLADGLKDIESDRTLRKRPIYVSVVNGVMYIRDGHHRVTYAHRHKQKTIKACVIEVRE